MKIQINNFINERIEKHLGILTLLILFSSITTAYEGIIVLLVSIMLSILAILLDLLFKLFKTAIDLFPMILMLNCTIGFLLGKSLEKICHNSCVFCMASVFISIFVFLIFKRLRNTDGKFETRNFLLISGILSLSLVFVGLLREFFATGKILSNITENGITLFPHKFGLYINSFSCFLLIICFVLFIYELISKRTVKVKLEKGTTTILSALLVSGSIFSYILFALSKILPDEVAVALIVAVIALMFFVVKSEMVLTSLVIVMTLLYLQCGTFLDLILCSVLSTVFIITSFLAGKEYSQSPGKHILSSTIFICSVIAFIYEKVMLFINA